MPKEYEFKNTGWASFYAVLWFAFSYFVGQFAGDTTYFLVLGAVVGIMNGISALKLVEKNSEPDKKPEQKKEIKKEDPKEKGSRGKAPTLDDSSSGKKSQD